MHTFTLGTFLISKIYMFNTQLVSNKYWITIKIYLKTEATTKGTNGILVHGIVYRKKVLPY